MLKIKVFVQRKGVSQIREMKYDEHRDTGMHSEEYCPSLLRQYGIFSENGVLVLRSSIVSSVARK